jgi:2-polyprenyl-6-methoxyphenol hydroxylase-like FAD-dependent oxidoreductase
VRQKIYSDNEIEKKYLGYYVCAFNQKVPLHLKRKDVASMICPKKQLVSYTTDDISTSLFVFNSPLRNSPTDKEKIEVLKKEFADFVSPVPEIIEQGSRKERIFFDQVSQIRIKSSWHKHRVALVGDAAYCITLLSGQGASMAMTGAYVLAEKMNKYPNDHSKAFSEFEEDLRPKVDKMQKKAVKNAATYLPSNNFSLFLRNLFAPLLFSKIFAPLIIKQLGAENYFE